MKLGLGTVEFGMDYGLMNHRAPSQNEISTILKYADESGMRFIDTAPAYGSSEERIGQGLPNKHSFRIVTKTPVFSSQSITSDDLTLLSRQLEKSLHALKQEKVYGLLIHRPFDLSAESTGRLLQEMRNMQKKGLVSKIGISVYSWEEIKNLQEHDFDIVQVPANVLDQRFLAPSKISRLNEKNIEVHTRSVFLQGLLLMDCDKVPAYFDPIKPVLKKFGEICQSHNLTPVEGALNFILRQPGVETVLVGINSLQQLREIVSAARKVEEILIDWSACAITDENFLNPSRWKTQGSVS